MHWVNIEYFFLFMVRLSLNFNICHSWPRLNANLVMFSRMRLWSCVNLWTLPQLDKFTSSCPPLSASSLLKPKWSKLSVSFWCPNWDTENLTGQGTWHFCFYYCFQSIPLISLYRGCLCLALGVSRGHPQNNEHLVPSCEHLVCGICPALHRNVQGGAAIEFGSLSLDCGHCPEPGDYAFLSWSPDPTCGIRFCFCNKWARGPKH